MTANVPSKNEYDVARSLKQSDELLKRLKEIKIGVAGLGGLGSNIAMMLVRVGVGKIVIADKDTVEISNLNRQNYYYRHLGQRKTDATEELLKEMDPHIEIEKHFITLDIKNTSDIFKGCDIVCEALDSASGKAMLINTLLLERPEVIVVSGSGMAGYGRSNRMAVEHPLDKLYICGDGVDFEERGSSLMAPRVNICAGQIANTVLALIMEDEV